MRSQLLFAATAFAAVLNGGASARSADHFPAYFGAWIIASADPAPWLAPGSPLPAEHGLVGKTVIYTPDRISGPKPLRCRRPDYRLVDIPPEGLFQGNLVRPAAQAHALGLIGAKVRTLQTGCAGLIDFHFTETGDALFALDNRIYTLRKDAQRGAR